MHLALATCATLPLLDSDDQLLISPLKTLGFQIDTPIWDDPSVDWSHYDAVIIRSTWDYVPKRTAYLEWIHHVASQTMLFNSESILTWNTDKRYLQDLEQKGVPVVPTQWLEAGSTIDLEELLQSQNWEQAVIKPVISSSGLDTYHVTPSNLAALTPTFQALLAERDVMVQPYFQSVETEGELSFLFFDDVFSHAVRKVPQAGEFKVQVQFGGCYETFQPTAEQLAFAKNVLRHMPDESLYARVDAMLGEDGQLALGELEVTEPSMYLAQDPESPFRFAQAIQQTLAVSQIF